ncbi:unnamed protein product [Sphacelaria rigidula]
MTPQHQHSFCFSRSCLKEVLENMTIHLMIPGNVEQRTHRRRRLVSLDTTKNKSQVLLPCCELLWSTIVVSCVQRLKLGFLRISLWRRPRPARSYLHTSPSNRSRPSNSVANVTASGFFNTWSTSSLRSEL